RGADRPRGNLGVRVPPPLPRQAGVPPVGYWRGGGGGGGRRGRGRAGGGGGGGRGGGRGGARGRGGGGERSQGRPRSSPTSAGSSAPRQRERRQKTPRPARAPPAWWRRSTRWGSGSEHRGRRRGSSPVPTARVRRGARRCCRSTSTSSRRQARS